MNEFEKAKTIGCRAVFNVLQIGSSTIAEFDKGQTLWSLYQVLQEFYDWWAWH